MRRRRRREAVPRNTSTRRRPPWQRCGDAGCVFEGQCRRPRPALPREVTGDERKCCHPPGGAPLSQSVNLALFSLVTEDGSLWIVGSPGARPAQEAPVLASRAFGDESVSDESSTHVLKCSSRNCHFAGYLHGIPAPELPRGMRQCRDLISLLATATAPPNKTPEGAQLLCVTGNKLGLVSQKVPASNPVSPTDVQPWDWGAGKGAPREQNVRSCHSQVLTLHLHKT